MFDEIFYVKWGNNSVKNGPTAVTIYKMSYGVKQTYKALRNPHLKGRRSCIYKVFLIKLTTVITLIVLMI